MPLSTPRFPASQIARPAEAGLCPHTLPIHQTSLLGTAPTFPEPALSQNCLQERPRSPRFSPISRSKLPPTSQKGTIENPCTRNDTRSGPKSGSGGPRRRLDDSGRPWKTARFHVASMWLQLSCGHPLADFPFGNSRRNSPFTKPAAPPVDRDVGAPLTTRLRMRDDKSKIPYYYTRQKERPCPSSPGTPTHHLLPVPGDDPPVAACSEGGGPHRERAAP